MKTVQGHTPQLVEACLDLEMEMYVNKDTNETNSNIVKEACHSIANHCV